MDREELAGWLRLSMTPGVGSAVARSLLAAFGLPPSIFGQSAAALSQVVPDRVARALAEEPPGFAVQVAATAAWLEQGESRHVVTLGDSAYPGGFLALEDPPILFYATGQLPVSWPASIAIVGSRNPTPQGAIDARRFAASLAQAGLAVVSGMALGVDGAAHEGALEAAAPGSLATIAVVGTGIDRVYPRRHLDLAHRIASRGVIVSEYPIGTPPLPQNFAKRNRLIAALGLGTLVVEAALQSGSLITARLAAELGKDVFAIPGSIHSAQSRGCHALIRQGAKLVETAQDVLEELPAFSAPITAAAPPAPAPAPGDDLLEALGHSPVSLDALVARTGIDAARLQARLMELELRGEVARLPGGLFQRIALA